MAKVATEAMATVWAKNLGRDKFLVNVVAPTLTATEMGFRLARALTGISQIDELDPQMPLGHVCRPEEVAETVIFLVSPANSYVSGQRLYVNGGMLDLQLTEPA